jgi:hypothetical protein
MEMVSDKIFRYYYQCCGSGSGIRSLFDPRIRDPGWVKNQDPDPGSWIRDEQPVSYFLELRNYFFGLTILEFFDVDPGLGIRDGNNLDPGSGMEKSRIRDKHPGSATLVIT